MFFSVYVIMYIPETCHLRCLAASTDLGVQKCVMKLWLYVENILKSE